MTDNVNAGSDNEKQLWCAVIRQALDDVTWTTPYGEHAASAEHARVQARAWLMSNSRDFKEVCYLAGFDPARVRKHAAQVIEEADRNRPAPSAPTVAPSSVSRSNSPKHRRITFRGETRTIPQWGDIVGLSTSALNRRIRSGWSIEDALTIPKTPRGTKVDRKAKHR